MTKIMGKGNLKPNPHLCNNAALNLIRHNFHGDWNYTIKPKNNPAPKSGYS